LFGDRMRKRYNKKAEEFYAQFADEIYYKKDGIEYGLDIQTLWWFRTNEWIKDQPKTKEVDWEGIRNIISDNMDELAIEVMSKGDTDCADYVNDVMVSLKQKLNQ